MKTINPELLRNLWLEMTPHRMIVMPAALAGIFVLTHLVVEYNSLDYIQTIAITLFYMFTVFWGTRLAGEAIISEVKDCTWDTQRMTAIGPWSMTWGKLFGSTSYAWYGAGLCLVVYGAIGARDAGWATVKIIVSSILVAILTQSAAMLSSMFAMERKAMRRRTSSMAFMAAGLLLLLPFLKLIFSDQMVYGTFVSWYGMTFQPVDFALGSLLLFSAWSVTGLYRKMRAELQFRNRPFIWVAFSAFTAFYVAGLVDLLPIEALRGDTARLFAAFFVVLILSYIALIVESKNPLVFRRLLIASQVGNWGVALQNVSAWLANIPLLLMLLLAIAYLDLPFSTDTAVDYFGKGLAASLFVFLLRDMALVVFLHLGANTQRADTTAIVYLLILYWLVPSLAGAMGLPEVAGLFQPLVQGSTSLTLISGVAQVGVLGYLIQQRWRRVFPVSQVH